MLLKDKKIMPPPWLAFPDIERYSIGWRMGYGEDYIYRFGDWLDTLSPEERKEYRSLFPEPITWKGWWDDEDSSEVLVHGDFFVEVWQPKGQPKYTKQWLQQEVTEGRKQEFCLFWGHQPSKDGSITKSCLSQWWMEDFYTMVDSYLYMEQYMMAGKAQLFGDEERRKEILACSDPKQIKALGRKVRGFDQVVWDKFKYAIVLNGNWCKFSQNRELREFL
ncbi:NADAR family protein, partial [Anaerotignum sp.]